MIAQLPTVAPSANYPEFLEALRNNGFRGQISADYATRTVLATDNSIYQRLPQAAVFPLDADDVARVATLMAEARFRHVKLTRAAGGTNGQSLTDGIVVDLSRHMNNILEINVEERWVRVQAGTVKDQLNAALKPYGLFFAPELSTSNRATVGGMINTDASGQGSCTYGKTRDHVLGCTACCSVASACTACRSMRPRWSRPVPRLAGWARCTAWRGHPANPGRPDRAHLPQAQPLPDRLRPGAPARRTGPFQPQ